MLANRVLFRSHANLIKPKRLFYSETEKKHGPRSELVLYGDRASPPVRFVMMTAAFLDVKVEFRKIDLFRGDQKTNYYKNVINPLHKVPVLSVKKEMLRDSHAIATYLCERVGNTELYPNDTFERAKVNEMLFFNSSELFPVDSHLLTSYFAGTWTWKDPKIDRWNFLLDYLENILHRQDWLGGNKLTLSDLCCAATISSLRLLVPPLERHERVNRWMKNVSGLPCYEINNVGLERLNTFIEYVKENKDTSL